MILQISYDEKNVIDKGDGFIRIKIPYYAEFGTACHLSTTKGSTKEDFKKAPKPRSSKSVFVGQQGGITF